MTKRGLRVGDTLALLLLSKPLVAEKDPRHTSTPIDFERLLQQTGDVVFIDQLANTCQATSDSSIACEVSYEYEGIVRADFILTCDVENSFDFRDALNCFCEVQVLDDNGMPRDCNCDFCPSGFGDNPISIHCIDGDLVGECQRIDCSSTCNGGCVRDCDVSADFFGDYECSLCDSDGSYRRQEVDCGGGVMGYDSLVALNEDIAFERDRILSGESPEFEYLFTLCPDTAFDADEAPLAPHLDNIIIGCGDTLSSSESCIIVGGDPSIRLASFSDSIHPVFYVGLTGLTFAAYTGGVVTGSEGATEITILQFSDCMFEVRSTYVCHFVYALFAHSRVFF